MTPEVTLGLFKLIEGMAWPLVVVILAVVYKHDILSLKPLLGRVRKAKLWKVEVEVDAADQQQKAGALVSVDVSSGTIELKELPGLTRTEAIGNLERELHVNLKNVTENQVDILIRNLAQARLETAFGIVYAGIFGSQIVGLNELAARRKVAATEAYTFYQEFEKKYPEIYAGYGFSGWIGFLKDRGLVAQTGDDIRITPLGDDFLTWLRATKLSRNKAW
jgi:hypothetical protein